MLRSLTTLSGVLAPLLLVAGGCGRPAAPEPPPPRARRVLADGPEAGPGRKLEFLEYQDEEPYRVPERPAPPAVSAAPGALARSPWKAGPETGSGKGGGDKTAVTLAPVEKSGGLTREEVMQIIRQMREKGEPALDPSGIGENYRYGPGDAIQVWVNGHPEFSGRHVIAGDGSFVMPTIGNIVSAGGLTPDRLRNRVAALLYPAYLRRRPRVSVRLIRSEQRAYFVFGEVARPGRYVTGDRLVTVLSAVLAANGSDGIGPVDERAEPRDERWRGDGLPSRKAETDAASDNVNVNGNGEGEGHDPFHVRRAAPPPPQWHFVVPDKLRPRLDKVVLIVRGEGGDPVRFLVDLRRVMAGHRGANPEVRAGQVVYVPSAAELKDKRSLGHRLVQSSRGLPVGSLEKLETNLRRKRAPR